MGDVEIKLCFLNSVLHAISQSDRKHLVDFKSSCMDGGNIFGEKIAIGKK